MNRSFRLMLGAAALLSASLPVYAGVSMDRASQSIPACPFPVNPASLYRWGVPMGGCDVGGLGPVTEVWEGSLGLVPADNVDAVSANTTTGKNINYHIYFSADRASLGMLGTPYRAEATLNQAASDIWRMNNLTVASPLASLAACAPTPIGGAHALFRNQDSYDFIFTAPPGVGPLGGNYDNIDALELDDLDPSLDKFHDVGVYFSLDAASPSLGGASAAAIFFTPVGGAPGVWSGAAPLGLVAADDIDALVVWDRGVVGAPDPGMDLVLFSLAPGSPSLGGLSPAGIFVSDLTGFFCVYVQANTLGMRVIDNIDGLDVLP
ncbi:MAG: hypothetical protein ABUT39_03370 [Acidobacteriota bacterium]